MATTKVDVNLIDASGITSSKYLKGDGTWGTVDALPSQTSQSGKFLTTDGSDASWATTGGKILQIVQTVDTDVLTSTSTSFVTTDIAVTITPTESDSDILIIVAGGIVRLPGNGGFASATIYRDAVNLDADGLSQHGQSYAGLAAGTSGFDFRRPESMFYLDTGRSSGTSAITYTVYAKVSAQTMTYGDASIPMTMTAMEVSA